MKQKVLSASTAKTKKLGKDLAKKILRTAPSKKAVVLGLEGDLGSGKTTFLQGFARGLGIKEKILSPTFVIMKKFAIKTNTHDSRGTPTPNTFYHIDCYRIQKSKEILDLGFKEIISDSQNIVAIEWSERIKKVLPKQIILLRFRFVDKNKREISFTTM